MPIPAAIMALEKNDFIPCVSSTLWCVTFSSLIEGGGSTSTYKPHINPYPTAFPYGNGMVLHFYQQQESSTNKTVHKVINKGLKTYV